jgi:tyrosyl-tRNA synthetase
VACVHAQLQRFLDFNLGRNSAEMVNNYDWFKDFTFLDFIRDVGKHITVNYMMAKDSVKNRLERSDVGLSFTEFTYQLVQGYDFYWLFKNKNCKLQMGGSDQWGNIVTGTELIRRKDQGEAYALTTQLIKKADGTKFGKTEGGNVWLDPKKTSPYKFYQYWMNVSDEDALNFIKIFTLLTREEIEALAAAQAKDSGGRMLQKALAKDITIRVHSEDAYEAALKTSSLIFNSTIEELAGLDDETFSDVVDGLPQNKISRSVYESIATITDLLAQSGLFASKGEARKMIQGGGVSVNKKKIQDPNQKLEFEFLKNKYLITQKGKTNYNVIIVE